jgi:hypothetical protein
MTEKEYVIFCDESDAAGVYYSNFYGGLVVGASQYERVTNRLEAAKLELNLHQEVKWAKVTQNYLNKYQALISCLFDEVAKGHIKIRIMFRQNAHEARGLTAEQTELAYFRLYYQFVKHAFGLTHVAPTETGTRIRLYFHQFPDTRENAARFKGFLLGLQHNKEF